MTKTTTILLTLAFLISAPAFAQEMSFFLTSHGPGDGAKLGGLNGADAHCTMLAKAAGSTGKTWRAYLSAKGVNAKDRIGKGPWVNANGVTVATDVANLHSDDNMLSKEKLGDRNAVTSSTGAVDTPNRHDVLTGSQLDGTAFSGGDDHTCGDWTKKRRGAAPNSAITTAKAAATTPPPGTRRTVRAAVLRRTFKPPAAMATFTASPNRST